MLTLGKIMYPKGKTRSSPGLEVFVLLLKGAVRKVTDTKVLLTKKYFFSPIMENYHSSTKNNSNYFCFSSAWTAGNSRVPERGMNIPVSSVFTKLA